MAFYYFVVVTIIDFVRNHTRCIPIVEYLHILGKITHFLHANDSSGTNKLF